jgi:chromosome segregation ATPase
VSVEQTRLEDELRRLSNGMRGTEIEIRQKKDEKAKYANSRTDKLSVFGHRMPEIVRVMSQKTFRGPVFGPLGNYVKIDSKFSKKFCKAIEKGIKERNLQAFVVTCNEDRNVIAGILSQFKVGHEHAIHVHNLKPRYKVDHVNAPGSVTISDALIIDNDLVHNVLVNIAHIESIVLVNDYNEAIQTLTELDAHGKLTFKKFVSKAVRGEFANPLCIPYRVFSLHHYYRWTRMVYQLRFGPVISLSGGQEKDAVCLQKT